MKTFDTAGPTEPDKHYSIPPLARWDMDEIRRLIQEKRYFVLHAPRQTGETTCLLALMEKLNAEVGYTALYVNLESGQSARGDVQAGMRTVIGAIARNSRRYLDDRRPEERNRDQSYPARAASYAVSQSRLGLGDKTLPVGDRKRPRVRQASIQFDGRVLDPCHGFHECQQGHPLIERHALLSGQQAI